MKRQARIAARPASPRGAVPRRERRGPRRCAFVAPPRQTQTTDRLQGCDLRRDRRGSRTVLYLQDSPQQPGCDQSPSSAPPHSDPRIEVLLQDGLVRHNYNIPRRFHENIDRCPQEAGILRFCDSSGAGSKGSTVINVPQVVGRASSVGWPHSGLRIEDDRQFDGAGVPAVRQPGRLSESLRTGTSTASTELIRAFQPMLGHHAKAAGRPTPPSADVPARTGLILEAESLPAAVSSGSGSTRRKTGHQGGSPRTAGGKFMSSRTYPDAARAGGTAGVSSRSTIDCLSWTTRRKK